MSSATITCDNSLISGLCGFFESFMVHNLQFRGTLMILPLGAYTYAFPNSPINIQLLFQPPLWVRRFLGRLVSALTEHRRV